MFSIGCFATDGFPALGFSDRFMKPKTRNKKRDVNQLPKPKIKKRASVKKDDANVSKGRTPKKPNKKRLSKVEYSKNNVKPVESNLINSKHSLTSMLSQESSSSTQIRMMDDAFNTNHRYPSFICIQIGFYLYTYRYTGFVTTYLFSFQILELLYLLLNCYVRFAGW